MTKEFLLPVKHLFVALALALAVLPGRTQISSRALPDDNLAYPVLITYKNGTGSGFYLATTTGVYLVTAKHVLFDLNSGKPLDTSFSLISYSKDLSDPTPNSMIIDIPKLAAENLIKHAS